MSSNNTDLPGEHWYGAQEAAQYLGIHRSTLHLAINRGTLAPDRKTPGGHVRFRQETLDRYRSTLEHQAATSSTAIASMDTIARISASIGAREPANDICQAAAKSIQMAQPGVDAVAIILLNQDREPPDLDLVADINLPAAFFEEYQRLHQEGIELAMNHVWETGEAEIVPDTTLEQLRFGTNRLTHVANIRAYAVYPIMQGQQGLGALILISHVPHHFTSTDRVFLRSVAAELALAIRAEAFLELTGNLVAMAMGRAAGPEITGGRPATRLRDLHDLLLRRIGAEAICVLGFDDGGILDSGHPRLRQFTEQALEQHEPRYQQFRQRGTQYTALTLGIPLYDEHAASVGVLWRGIRSRAGSDVPLLWVFAGACALASERVRLRDSQVDFSEEEDL